MSTIPIRKQRINTKPNITKVNQKVLLDENSTIFFGKQKGRTVKELLEKEPGYLIGLSKGNFFEVSKSVINSAYCRLNWLAWEAK